MLAAETREWLDRARADLRACEVLIQAGLHAEALFHAQQCTEKAMKAVLTWHQIPFKKTHDLDDLRQACLPLNPEFASHGWLVLRDSHSTPGVSAIPVRPICPSGPRRNRPKRQRRGCWKR
jgi:HEPN domain